MEDIIGLIIFLFIMYRTIADRKKGKQKSLSDQRRDKGRDEQMELSPLQNGEEQESEAAWESLEELAEKILGVEDFITEDEEDFSWEEEQIEVKQKEQDFSPELVSGPEAVAEELVSATEVAVDEVAKSATKSEVEVVCSRGSSFTGVDLRQAVIWSEILQKPKALRHRR